MTVPRLGYLCLAENPSAEAGRALVRQFVLVREADRTGYDDIWLGEQHGDSAWPTGGVLSLLGHLVAVTSKARTQAACARYAATAGRPPALTLARFACSADTRDQALAIATPYFEALAARATRAGWGADPSRSIAQSVPALIAQSLVGSHAEVAAQVQALGAQQGVARVAIVPSSGQFDTHKHILAAFVDEVRPLLDD